MKRALVVLAFGLVATASAAITAAALAGTHPVQRPVPANLMPVITPPQPILPAPEPFLPTRTP